MTDRSFGRIGVIGDPVDHSLSPVFQQAAFDALGLNIRYELLHTPAEDIEKRIAELRSGEFAGANVTVPHKEVFFQAVDERSEIAQRAGAVNTIVCRDGQLYGDNTDVYGFAQALVDAGFTIEGSRALILGAGGASRAAVLGLLDRGAAAVVLANRTLDRAVRLASDLADDRIKPVELANVEEHLPDVSLIVNATSLGWQGEALPLDPEAFSRVKPGTIAYDLTYRETPFLGAARAHGLPVIDGLPMLVHQGARGFELWTGQPAPFDIMWDAAQAARG